MPNLHNNFLTNIFDIKMNSCHYRLKTWYNSVLFLLKTINIRRKILFSVPPKTFSPYKAPPQTHSVRVKTFSRNKMPQHFYLNLVCRTVS